MACLLDMGWWGLPDVDLRVRLQKAWADFCDWKSANKVSCSQRPFTPGMLFKANHGAYLSCKGFNSRVLSSWLATEAQKAWQGTANPSDELTLMTHALPLGSTLLQFPSGLHPFLFSCCGSTTRALVAGRKIIGGPRSLPIWTCPRDSCGFRNLARSVMDFVREALHPKPGHFRTPEEAMQLYSAGLGFLESHVALTRLCQRTAGTPHGVKKDSFGRISPRQEEFEKMAVETQISCALLSDQGRGLEIRNKSICNWAPVTEAFHEQLVMTRKW